MIFWTPIPSIAGLSQNRTGTTEPSWQAKARSKVGSVLAEQANWARSQSGPMGTARGPLTSYIIK